MKFITGFFKCAGIGVFAVLGLYALAFVLELVNCLTCGMLSCICNSTGGGEGTLDQACNFGCAKDCSTGVWSLIPVWSKSTFYSVFMFCSTAGVAIGLVYGIVIQIQENEINRGANEIMKENMRRAVEEKRRQEEEERRKEAEAQDAMRREQRQKNADEFQRSLRESITKCRRDVETSETWGLNPAYEVVTVQKDVWNAVDEASVPLQRLEDIVSELKAKASWGGK